MELLQLKYFCDAAKSQNFSKTAKKYMVPPSAVSQSIRRLERELGVSLFERNSNKIVLNEAGKTFYASVSQISQILTDVRKKLSDNNETVSGEIKLQIFCNRRIVYEAIKAFKQMYPEVSFILNHGSPSADAFDLIISDDYSDSSFSKIPLLTEDIAIGVAKTHPLADKDEVKLTDLSGESFITMHQNGRQYHLTRQLCTSAGFQPKISIQCDDPFYIRQYIEIGLGVGFVPLFSWQGQLSGDMICKKLDSVTRTTYVYWDSSRYMSKAAAEFLKILTKLCSFEQS